MELLREPEVTIDSIVSDKTQLFQYPSAIINEVEIEIKYSGYLDRQDREVARFSKLENLLIPEDFDYTNAEGLSAETKEKCKLVKPLSVGQMSRISGVRVSDVAVMMALLKGKHND